MEQMIYFTKYKLAYKLKGFHIIDKQKGFSVITHKNVEAICETSSCTYLSTGKSLDL